jgi:LysR family glycine cleavage system transcriptional activator
MRKLPSLNAMRAFEAAARHVSFTKAADELFVTHAAVSRHIRDLEEWLGVKLFNRTGRGVSLTKAGEKYLNQLSLAFDRLAKATSDVMQDAQTGDLSVSVEEAFASRWLVPHLGAFTSAHRDIELSIDPDDTLVNFRSSPVNLGIRYGLGDWPGVEVELLVRTKIFPVCSPDLIDGKVLRSAEDLKDFSLLHEESKQWWTHWLRAEGITDTVNARGPMFQGHLALEAAEAGQGFALGDQVLTAGSLRDGSLVKPLPGFRLQGAYYLVTPQDVEDTVTVRAFRVWLHAEMAKTEKWFSESEYS